MKIMKERLMPQVERKDPLPWWYLVVHVAPGPDPLSKADWCFWEMTEDI